MASLTPGYSFGSTEQVTNSKLATLVSGGTVSSIVDADISSGASIALSKINVTTASINYDRLNLNGNIVNADISASAAIDGSKLAGLGNIASGAGVIPLANIPNTFTSGMIMMWSGSIATIPSGWVLCNGSNSTPDLRNRFVVCADADVVGVANSTVTGSAAQTGNGQLPSTTVNMSTSGLFTTGTGNNHTGLINASAATNSTPGTLTGSFGTGSVNVAVFYALAYIMKT